jgi:hypothetical protein
MGVIVTQKKNSLTRSILDISRTFFIWVASLILGWEKFKIFQVLKIIKVIRIYAYDFGKFNL